MAKTGLNVNATKFLEASRRLALLAGKRTPMEVMTLHMRQFVSNVLAITPPAQGELSGARKRGEATILADLLTIAQPVTVAGSMKDAKRRGLMLMTTEELLALHAAQRNPQTGRVRREQREARFVSQSDFNEVLRGLVELVGILAAGWNPACAKLGVSVPAWIKRHGTRYGSVELVSTATTLRISMVNDVPFADAVTGLQRRVTFALRQTANELEKGYAAALARAARQSGFR
jgi:hypothetical protein